LPLVKLQRVRAHEGLLAPYSKRHRSGRVREFADDHRSQALARQLAGEEDEHLGELTLVQALLALPLIGIAIGVLMFAGAALWLVVARYWVPREIAAGFFLVDGVGWFSAVSRWLFEGAYGK